MGLDLVIERREHTRVASRAYTGFADWRRELASLVGLDLDAMIGHGGTTGWPAALEEPAVFILDHSDCDGYLSADECTFLAPRLFELADRFAHTWDQEFTRVVAAACQTVADEADEGTTLVFA